MIHIPKIGYIYPIFILFSFIVLFIAIYLRNKKKYKKEVLFYGFLTSFICSMFGGVAFHLITNNFKLGLSSYGGAIGLIASVFIYSKILASEKTVNISNENIKNLKEEFLMHIPLVYSISKIACGMNGCCYGFEYNGLLSVCYDGVHSYFPIQFIETLVFLLIYLIGISLLKNKENKVLIIFIISAFCKAKLECLRYGYGGFNVNQTVSYIFIVISLLIIFLKGVQKSEKRKLEKAE